MNRYGKQQRFRFGKETPPHTHTATESPREREYTGMRQRTEKICFGCLFLLFCAVMGGEKCM